MSANRVSDKYCLYITGENLVMNIRTDWDKTLGLLVDERVERGIQVVVVVYRLFMQFKRETFTGWRGINVGSCEVSHESHSCESPLYGFSECRGTVRQLCIKVNEFCRTNFVAF